jgi:hypothetical protein
VKPYYVTVHASGPELKTVLSIASALEAASTWTAPLTGHLHDPFDLGTLLIRFCQFNVALPEKKAPGSISSATFRMPAGLAMRESSSAIFCV